MKRSEALKLKPGDRVRYLDQVDGTVTSINAGVCINVEWDDGEKSATSPYDCAFFALAREAAVPS